MFGGNKLVKKQSTVGIICSGSDASALGTCALPRTGMFRISKLQLAYSSIKVVKKNKNRGVESDRFPQVPPGATVGWEEPKIYHGGEISRLRKSSRVKYKYSGLYKKQKRSGMKV